MTKIDLITGFLGSGKTTFIKEYAKYLSDRYKRICIIASDHGAINVDRMMLEEELGDSCHIEMVIGGDADCARRRLKTKLIAAAMDRYEYVIVEPSGLFDVDTFYDILYEEPLERWYEIGNVIAIVDAGVIGNLSDSSRYVMSQQVAKAGFVLVSKAQSDGEADSIIRYLNQNLELYRCTRRIKSVYIWHQGSISDQDFEQISNSGYNSGELLKLPVGEYENFDSLFFFHCEPDGCNSKMSPIMDESENDDLLKSTFSHIFEDPDCGKVLRLKGYIPQTDGSYVEINATANSIDSRIVKDGQSLFIVIGEDLSYDAINKYLHGTHEIL